MTYPTFSFQVKLAITHHTIGGSADALKITAEKSLVFVLDPPKQQEEKKDKKGKKKKAGVLNPRNFGSIIDISKLKGARHFVIGWRARFPSLIIRMLFFVLMSDLLLDPNKCKII